MHHNEVKPAHQELNKIQDVRNQIVNGLLVVGSLLSIASLITTIIKEMVVGWQNETFGFIVLVLLLVILTILRHRVSYRLKTITILLILYLGGVLNLLGWGIIGGGEIWLLVMVVFTLYFYNRRISIMAFALALLTLMTLTLMLQTGRLHIDVDATVYAYSLSVWVTRILTFVLVSALLLISLGRIIVALQEQVVTYRHRTDELIDEMDRRSSAEESLADAIEQLKDLDKLKDQFIDSISHELRTPIANIQLYHQLIGMNPTKAKAYLATLQNETERLAHIVEQLLHASSDVYDMALITMVDIDLQEMTISLFKTCAETLEKQQINLQLPSGKEQFMTLASSRHIERALGNLVDNAVKYTLPAGHIRVEMVRGEHGGCKMVGILIENSSDCLSREDQDVLFDRFTRGENSLNQGVAGVGLGLSIARQIVEQYTGHIDFYCSADEKLMTFTVWLPETVPAMEHLSGDSKLPEPST